HVVAALERPAEPGDIGLAQARLAGPVHDLHVRVGFGQLIGEVAGPVRAAVVHDQQIRRRQRRSHPARDGVPVLPLVVRRHHDDHPSRRRIGGRVWSSHAPCLSLLWFTRRAQSRRLVTDSAGHDIPAPASGRRLRVPQSTVPEGTTNLPSGSCLDAAGRARKDPGSAFGPEPVPLATSLVPVVYWMPGPFPGPTRPAGPLAGPVLDRPATYP